MNVVGESCEVVEKKLSHIVTMNLKSSIAVVDCTVSWNVE